jgi:PAS domain S-box-containing protein
MNPIWDGIERRTTLRRKAEALVSSLSPETMTAKPTDALLHELLVHKIELEMQNEELRFAHQELLEARDRYLDLYEYAPVGYISLSTEDLINDINQTGAAMLGIERDNLLDQRFSLFVAPHDSDRWFRQYLEMMLSVTPEKQTLGLDMKRGDGSLFHAHLDCLRRESANSPPMLRIALSDISLSRQTA